ncbi:hypothetical protein [Peptoniphilus harei]|uniref:hypothetical protein n=1 Tax=Peptoniphilus harei TaxID=54005 RepID=UPI001F2CE57B|nr:hypothetical protein [Peptoniphilus harei]
MHPSDPPSNGRGLLHDMNKVQGILNGTSNYILSKMEVEGSSYDEVLKEAQELGYAEADPTADVGGFDAMRKIRFFLLLFTIQKSMKMRFYFWH